MSRTIKAEPADLETILRNAQPGDIVELQPGKYSRLSLKRVAGTQAQPIRVKGHPQSVFDGGLRFQDFRLRANRVAREAQQRGKYPGVYPIALDAFFLMIECDWISVEDLRFEGCWPTAMGIKDCVGISIARCSVREGSFAIYAEGNRTSEILVEECAWIQDVSDGNDLWNSIGWHPVHGDHPVLDEDARAYDGDFFRANAIKGDVVIRNNTVEHAFNGIHLFNDEAGRPDTHLNRNVRIYGNTFRYIRDNPVEPEWGAWNWWIYHNSFFNCHKWFSLEMVKSGHFYIFGNVGWFDDMPGSIADDQYGGGVFKPPRAPKPDGPHYVFHNSWYMRSSYIKKKGFRRFLHLNNAIQYCASDCHGSREGELHCVSPKPFFGEKPPGETQPDAKKRFTTEWKELDIRFENDVIWHPHFPEHLRAVGYPFGDGWRLEPGFHDPKNGDFSLVPDAAARGKSKAFAMELPDGTICDVPGGSDVGAFQGSDLFTLPSIANAFAT